MATTSIGPSQICWAPLAAGEQHYRVASHHPELRLFLRYLSAPATSARADNVVLYVHGATFPSGLSIAHRFDDRSWRDELVDAGFHVWGLDFLGYGCSDRYPAMARPANESPPVGRADDAARQIEAAVRFITQHHGIARLHIIAHSLGTVATGLFANREPELVNRLVFFGPIAQRHSTGPPPTLPAWILISAQAQWDRFIEDVPPGEPAVLDERHFREWAEAYLATDSAHAARNPHSVQIPAGALAEPVWYGRLAYDPTRITAPVAIVRGAWDSLMTDADAHWLFDALSSSPIRCDVKIDRATHLMHLEANRHALYRESIAFLRSSDAPAGTCISSNEKGEQCFR